MPAFALRFVGQDTLPSRLSEFDREQFFELSSADVTAIRAEFRSAHRLPAALMLLFIRVAGQPLDGFTVLPRNLLRHTANVLGVSPSSIASLRSIYKRRQTLSKHQLWAKNYLELRDVEPGDEELLTAALSAQAEDASHTDDLVLSASHWLFTRRILIPGVRRLQDWARDAFAAVEAQILAEVTAAVPPMAAQKLVDSAYRMSAADDATNLEWLKAPSERHGPSTFAESVDKVRYLKNLGAHAWDLSGMHRAAEHLGRLLRTVFLCDYIAIEDFRREIHTLLNRGESVHQLQRAVYSGKVSPERGRRRDEMRAISGSHALLTNVVLAWTTSRMHEVIERLKRDGTRIEDDWLRRIGPAHFAHINFRGTMRFGVEKYVDALAQRQTGRATQAAG